MKLCKRLLLIFLMLKCTDIYSQELSRKVSFVYSNQELGYVLTDISVKHNINFSYSKYFVPVRQRVSVQVEDEPLSDALNELFDETDLAYASIGGHIVLRQKEIRAIQPIKQNKKLPKEVEQTSPIYPEQKPSTETKKKDGKLTQREPPVIRRKTTRPIQKPDLTELPGGDGIEEPDLEKFRLERPVPEEPAKDTRLAQVSLLPFLSTNIRDAREMTNTFSLNVLWGRNGGVEGVEVGGLVNAVTNDMIGVQVAGLGNVVGNRVVGTQIAGLFNIANGRVQGLQWGMLFNHSGGGDAVQLSSLFNVANGDFAGVQGAFLFNRTKGKSGLQMATLFNSSKGKTNTQISSLFNFSGDVEGAQISALMNVGKKVTGFQFALINVADTLTGLPIGLLNIVRKGYNRVELYAGETMNANFTLKLGVKSFYNIFYIGGRFDDLNENIPAYVEEPFLMGNNTVSWGLGYGVGSAITFSPRVLVNLEYLLIHINEYEEWTRELNLLNQFRLLLDVRLGRRTSLFLGPTANGLISRLTDPETGEVGSNLVPYEMENFIQVKDNLQFWIGFNAGFRF